jgi:hypothetical protein
MPVETFAPVFTGGKSRGWEKPGPAGPAVRVAIVVAPTIFGPAAKRTPIPARAAASKIANKIFTLISLIETT